MDLRTFIQALDCVEKDDLFYLLFQEYKKRSDLPENISIEQLTTIDEFIKKNSNNISPRLVTCLYQNKKYLPNFVEEIDVNDLLRCRNMGRISILEFEKLRGF